LKKKFKNRIKSWSNSSDDFGWIVDGCNITGDEAFYEWEKWDDLTISDDIVTEMKKDIGESTKDLGMRATEWLTNLSD